MDKLAVAGACDDCESGAVDELDAVGGGSGVVDEVDEGGIGKADEFDAGDWENALAVKKLIMW